MAATGLPIPRNDNVLVQAPPSVSVDLASDWQRIAATGAQIASEGEATAKLAIHQQQVAAIADFEVANRDAYTKARDQYAKDPEGFKTWADGHREGALTGIPSWMVPHAKQFLSREADGKYGAILGETRAEDHRLAGQTVTARLKMADEDVQALAAAGKANTPEFKTALATYEGIVSSAVSSKLISLETGQLHVEDVQTRATGTVIRNDVERVYREKGYEAARAHLDERLQDLGSSYRISDKIRTQTLGWLRSEEAGLRGERDAIGREWTAAKPNLATLAPDVLADIQQRAYAVGNFRVGDDIAANASALGIVKSIRQLPQADQVRILATGSLDAKLTQRESGGDPTKVNQLGYVGLYQFGAPRLADLGVYTPGAGENLAGWSKTPAAAPGKWTGTFNIPGFPDVKTLDQFKASPEAQKAAYGLHQQRTEEEIDRLGLGSFVGQTIGGVPITRDGIRAMVHLGGAEGARQTLTSGGRVNPADANGTTLLDYARLGDPSAKPGDITGSRAGLLALGMLKKDLGADLGKKITDFQAAIGKTEFPPMEEIGALGAQVHLLGTEEQKRQVAEMAAQAEYGKKFVQLPAAQRAEIVSRWNEKLKLGATAYERHLADTVKNADGKVTEEFKKDPYNAATLYMEGIAALPAIDWSSPVAPQVLQAKAAQQSTIRADQNIGVFSALRPGEATALATQLVSGDAAQSKAIIGMMAANLPPDIYKATITEGPIKTALDGMIRSYDPNKLDVAMSTLDQAWRADPLGFKAAFGETTVGRLQDWLARKDYLPPNEMAEYFKRADDPAFAAARKHLQAEADEKLKSLTPADVAYELGSAWGVPLTGPIQRNITGSTPLPPVDPIAGAALVAEYEQLYKERYVGTGDVDKAKQQAVERLKTVWGPSTVNSNALMRHPPERFYPQVDGSHDWMKRDVEAAISASRFGASETISLIGPGEVEIPTAYKLLSDARTDADVSAKRAPSYVVQVTDHQTGRLIIPLDWEGNPMRFRFDPANAQAAARERFTTNRAAPDPFSGRSNMANDFDPTPASPSEYDALAAEGRDHIK